LSSNVATGTGTVVRRTVDSPIGVERAGWRLSQQAVRALLLTPVAVHALLLALIVVDDPAFRWVTQEDGLIEWLQVAALLVGAGAFVVLAWRLRRSGRPIAIAAALVAAVGILIVAGEEISWGQRIFGWVTPAVLQAENVQGETNLHNLHAAALIVRVSQLAGAAYATLLPLALLFWRPSRRWLDPVLVPPIALLGFFAPLGIYWLLRVPLVPSFTMTRFSEVPELTFYTGLALIGILNVRRLESSPSATGA